MGQTRKSAKFKTGVVLELLRGESAEELSRKYGVTMSDISSWRDEFIENGTQGFKRNPEESKLAQTERRIGQLEMELDLVKKERLCGETKRQVVEALEPVWDAVRTRFGKVDKDVCKGMELKLRSDHGSQYDSNDFMTEMKFLGLNMSKSFVRQPECSASGCGAD